MSNSLRLSNIYKISCVVQDVGGKEINPALVYIENLSGEEYCLTIHDKVIVEQLKVWGDRSHMVNIVVNENGDVEISLVGFHII